ncbi:putative Protein of unknown function (DUF1077) [Trypanosoma vivax]|uniref:ER membrane protein complex subunit 4 n=1 Tax=Trypanosoma vivax (strain Y486) TaxID=1055687 RepID=G0TWT1_TRYVY|nr:hypothetical protein TRVL_00211 [Trypanosoma vivax]KAH8613889.1 putative Protein of unknown function (DUF1077) [Trypanosoma vivax]CCC48419.1 conserved hypothetical protein [Trypanosoma vivax Y486]
MSRAIGRDVEHDETRGRIHRRLNGLRVQPLKSLPMTLFMMWMVGNEVSIFSIMFVGMAVTNPLQSVFGTHRMFEEFEEDACKDPAMRSAVKQSKLIYVACCLAALAVAVVKLSWMGLLPVNAMDWLDNTPPAYKEHSFGAFVS